MKCDVLDFASGVKATAAKLWAAKVLIAPHGAGLTNMIWMQPNGVVIEMTSKERNEKQNFCCFFFFFFFFSNDSL